MHLLAKSVIPVNRVVSTLENLNPIWISLAPLIAVNLFFLVTLILFRATYSRRPHHEDLTRKHYSRFLSLFFVDYWYWLLTPLERGLVRLRIGPDALTITGLVFSAVAGTCFHLGMVGAGGWLMIFGATFDMLDGRIARLTGRESRSGAYFDSVIDRFSEGVVFLGLASWYREGWVLAFVVIGLIGSMMVSYTRARGEGIGIQVTRGIMQRPERIVYLGVGSIFSPIAAYFVSKVYPVPYDFMTILAVVVIALLTNLGAIWRIQYVLLKTDHQPTNRRMFRRIVGKWVK